MFGYPQAINDERVSTLVKEFTIAIRHLADLLFVSFALFFAGSSSWNAITRRTE